MDLPKEKPPSIIVVESKEKHNAIGLNLIMIGLTYLGII